MLSLTGVERKKYLADLEAKKAIEGYVVSDSAGVLQRKLKRKDVGTKFDAGVGDMAMEIDNREVARDGVEVPQADSPQPKR